jgi:pimeloyl-ACP methyl ester carboxylesterase
MEEIRMEQVLDRVEVSPDVVLPYVAHGEKDGLPVIFLHGITDSWRSFEPVLPFLPESIRAIAVSQRGHGDASKPVDGYDWLAYSGDVRSLLDALGIEKAVVVGHSFGSQVAMHFAVRYPDRVLGLVLMGAFAPVPDLPFMREAWDGFVSTVEDPIDFDVAMEFQSDTVARPVAPGLLDMAATESQKAPACVWKSGFQMLLRMNILDQLYKVQAPVQLIWGELDSMASCADQATLLSAFPRAQLTTWYGAGHAVHWEEPERAAEQIVEFALHRAGSIGAVRNGRTAQANGDGLVQNGRH